MLAGSGLAVSVRVAAWIVLVGSSGASAAGLTLPCGPVALAIVLAAPVALLALVTTLGSVWRGPPIISLVPEQTARCGPEDARLVRDAAQLRGAMGGAGHVHRSRLVFPAVAWTSALLAGADGVAGCAFTPPGPWVFLAAVAAVIAAWLWPSRPYWYLEADGGGALVSPPETVAAICSARAGDPISTEGAQDPVRAPGPVGGPGAARRTTLRDLGMQPPIEEPGAALAEEQGGDLLGAATDGPEARPPARRA